MSCIESDNLIVLHFTVLQEPVLMSCGGRVIYI